MTAESRKDWEDRVYDAIENKLELSRDEAVDLVNEDKGALDKAWERKESPRAAADRFCGDDAEAMTYIATLGASGVFTLETDRGLIEVEADTEGQARSIASAEGYVIEGVL